MTVRVEGREQSQEYFEKKKNTLDANLTEFDVLLDVNIERRRS